MELSIPPSATDGDGPHLVALYESLLSNGDAAGEEEEEGERVARFRDLVERFVLGERRRDADFPGTAEIVGDAEAVLRESEDVFPRSSPFHTRIFDALRSSMCPDVRRLVSLRAFYEEGHGGEPVVTREVSALPLYYSARELRDHVIPVMRAVRRAYSVTNGACAAIADDVLVALTARGLTITTVGEIARQGESQSRYTTATRAVPWTTEDPRYVNLTPLEALHVHATTELLAPFLSPSFETET